MSNIIELNIAEIDKVVGGTDRTRTPPEINPNRTMMAMPSVPTYSASVSRPATAPMYNATDLQARLDALR